MPSRSSVDNQHPALMSHEIPPRSWMAAADRKTFRDVMGIITAGFDMARKAPMRRRHQALREASFQAPHEVARLNSGAAPNFRLEDMGPVPSLPKIFEDRFRSKMGYPFNINKEARVFLYFPNGATKATAAFVAVNAEIFPPEWSESQRFEIQKLSAQQEYLVKMALVTWTISYMTWVEYHPHVLDRIESGQLPIIFNLRERASGCLYDTKAEEFTNLDTASVFASLNEPMVKKPTPGYL